MKIEEIEKELNDLGLCRFDNTEEQNKSIQRQTLYLTMILKLEADKLEMAKAIVEESEIMGEGITPEMYKKCCKLVGREK